MAELLVKAVSASHADPTKDQRGCYKRGMPVVVMPDDWQWGLEERLPKFVVIKIPTVSVSQVLKYIQSTSTRRRLYRIRWEDLPQSAQDKLIETGQLTIKAGSYTGPSDYTWAQVRAFFTNEETGVNESGNL